MDKTGATDLGATEATLHATIHPEGQATATYRFEYGPTTSYGTRAACNPASPGSGDTAVAVTAALTDLAADTTYHFRVTATNAGGTSHGSDRTFKTLPDPPTVTTGAASSVVQTSATLNAEIDPNGSEVSACKLEYGPTTSYGTSASCNPSPGSANSTVAVTAAITSLSANTTYHFRVSATNAGGTSHGSDQTLKTLTSAPTVQTGAALVVSQTTVTLNAEVNPNGEEVSECMLEYGPTTSYESSAPCSPPPGSGNGLVAVTAALSGLDANATYHFRIVATNATGTGDGNDQTFKTLPDPPTVTTGSATSVTPTSATLNAEVDANGGQPSECELEYGLTTSYGASSPCSPSPGSGNTPVAVSAALTGLDANSTYHFRVSATNAGGTSHGSDQTLKTLTSAPTAQTGAASGISQTSATLNAEVNPNGQEVDECKLEYGPTVSYGASAPCKPQPGSGNASEPVTAALTRLTAGDTYHFRVLATNASGTGFGADHTFTTQLPTTLLQQVPGEQETSPSARESPLQEPRTRPVPDAELASTSLTASSSGTVTVEVSCPASESSCSGTVTLRMPLGVSAAARGRKKAKAAILTLAVGSFKVAGGHVTTLRLRLSVRARTLLARMRMLHGHATIFARDPADTTHIAQATVTIRTQRAARKRET